MNLHVEPPAKKKTKSSSLLPSLPPSFFLLPDEIIVNCVARISRSYYPTLSIVSKSFRSLVSSTELWEERSRIGKTEQCLYVCLKDYYDKIPHWFTLWDNPNRTLPNSTVTKKKKKKTTIPQSLVSIPPSNFHVESDSVISVGFEIYVIGGVYGAASSAVRVLDCRSHTWRDAPSMNVARENTLSCVYDGKIYVLGGYKTRKCGIRKRLEEDDETWAEVFDTKTQTWEQLPNPGSEIRRRHTSRIAVIEGKIKFGNSSQIYAYDTKQGKWECFENGNLTVPIPKLECVIENVMYRYGGYGQGMCQWYDINDGDWKEVKGLDSLRNKYRRNGGSINSIRKLVSFGGKLLLIWEAFKRCNPDDINKIWCAEIVLEKPDGGEVWGNVEWVDVVHRVPASCSLLHCTLAVSI